MHYNAHWYMSSSLINTICSSDACPRFVDQKRRSGRACLGPHRRRSREPRQPVVSREMYVLLTAFISTDGFALTWTSNPHAPTLHTTVDLKYFPRCSVLLTAALRPATRYNPLEKTKTLVFLMLVLSSSLRPLWISLS